MTFKEVVFITVLCLLCYGRTFYGKFVFDDTEAIINNKDLDSSSPWENILQNDFWGTNIKSNASHKSYRPVTTAVYKMLVEIASNKDPRWFHFMNILLYINVCLLFYLHVKMLDRKLPFSATILFTVHPIHTEVVAGVVGCADLLCAIFFYIGLTNFHASILLDSIWRFFNSIFCIGISTFCKEVGITSVGVFLLLDCLLFFKNKKVGRNKFFYIRSFTLVFSGILLLYLRCWVMNFTTPIFQKADNPASFAENFLTRFLTYSYLYALNGILLIWPEWLCFDWSMGCIGLLETFYDLRLIIVITFWVAATLYLIKTIKKSDKTISFALIMTVITFLPATNLFFRVGFVIAERILFLPSAGFSILVTLGWQKLKRRYPTQKTVLNLLFCFLIIIFGLKTFYRSNEWLSEKTLFDSALNVCPNNAKVHYNVAKIAADNKNFTYAESEYRLALKLYPKYDQAMNNLANILRDRGEFVEAKNLLETAILLRKDFPAAWMNLGIVLASLNQDEDSEKAYKEALKYRKNYTDCFYNLGNLYLKQKRHKEAFDSWYETVKINPSHMAAWSNILILMDNLGQFEKVIETSKIALKNCPESSAIYFTTANTLGKLERWIEAEKHFEVAIKLNPKNALYYSNFGVLYHRWGKLEKAKEMYKKALTINPKLTTAATNLNKLSKK